jgi:hypothetical protein
MLKCSLEQLYIGFIRFLLTSRLAGAPPAVLAKKPGFYQKTRFLAVFAVSKGLFEMGKTISPAGKTIFPLGKTVLPAGRAVFPSGRMIFPPGKTILPAG